MDQLTLSFDKGISKKHRSLLDCCASGIYRRGLVTVAGEIDTAASNLSNALGGAGRKFGVDDLERYIEKFGDLDPVFYLVDKFLKNQGDINNDQLINQASSLMSEFEAVVRQLRDNSGRT